MKQTEKINLLFVEDHPIVRKGFISLLEEEIDINIIGEAQNGIEALSLIKQIQPDIIVTDISMPQMDGYELSRILRKKYPKIKIILFSNYEEISLISEMARIGVNSFLSKNCEFEEMLHAIKKVFTEGFYFNESISKKLITVHWGRNNELIQPLALTRREIEIVKLICNGNTNKQISLLLKISPDTVDTHRKTIYKKTGSNCVADLIMYSIRSGIVSVERN